MQLIINCVNICQYLKSEWLLELYKNIINKPINKFVYDFKIKRKKNTNIKTLKILCRCYYMLTLEIAAILIASTSIWAHPDN